MGYSDGLGHLCPIAGGVMSSDTCPGQGTVSVCLLRGPTSVPSSRAGDSSGSI